MISAIMHNFGDRTLHQHVSELFPLCRSILGPETRKTLCYFEFYHPEFQRLVFKSGAKVFDWEIPLEWSINNAYIENLESGVRYAEFLENNLHIMGYSIPVDQVLPLSELNMHLHTLPSQPDRVPYLTSYYSQDWGFCLSEEERSALPDGMYRIVIDSDLYDGELHISHALIKGSDKREIMFSSYICHPSMANNELSGPVILSALLDYVKNRYPKTRWSYRFVLQPESIGSIAYLSKFRRHLRNNLLVGVNLSCVGDEGPFSYVQTPDGDGLADKVLSSVLIGKANTTIHTFLERGSDERQYCAPGVDLDVATFTRSKFGTFSEYHTDADNLEYVTQRGLENSFQALTAIIDAFETCLFPRLTTLCEPQLGKRGLYPNVSFTGPWSEHPARVRSDVIAYSNGTNTIFDVCLKTQIPLDIVVKELDQLVKSGLIEDSSRQNLFSIFRKILEKTMQKIPKIRV